MFVGYEGIVGTGLFQRTLMMLTPKAEFDDRFRGLRKRRITLFTALQLVLFGLCWAINLSPAGLAVAFLIVALVPLRERLLPRIFTPEELSRLDGDLGDATSADDRRVPAPAADGMEAPAASQLIS